MPGIRGGVCGAIVVAVLCAAPAIARGAEPPEPEVRAALAISEAELDALSPGDARRGTLLVQLAVRRHAEAAEALAQEQVTRELSLVQSRAANEGGRAAAGLDRPSKATPRADALRAQVVTFAQRALDEAPATPELPDALIVAGVDADRLGRAREALHLLAALVRRHPDSPQVGDAWLALGEHHLRNADLTRARVAFEDALRRGRPAVRAWAASRLSELHERVGERRKTTPGG